VAEVALEIDIGSVLRMSSGERRVGGASNPSNLEDALEALIGAIYLDGGFANARQFIEKFWQNRIDTQDNVKNAKSMLQELLQSHNLLPPNYELIKTVGPAHRPTFVMRLAVLYAGKDIILTASGHSKKETEFKLADLMLQRLQTS